MTKSAAYDVQMDAARRLVTSGAARLSVASWGSDAAPAIVALHPGVGDSRIWESVADGWSDAGYRVIAPDRRGYGLTEWRPELHDDVDDLRAVVEACAADPAIIVGNSRGGGVALDYAIAHPDAVAALVLIAPSISGFDYSTWVEVAAEIEQDQQIAAADARDDLEVVNRLETRYWLDGVEQPEGRVSGPARELFIEMNARALRAGPVGDTVDRPEVWSRLDEIRVPVLVMVGALDLPGFAPQCQALAERLPQGRLVTLPASAHCPSLDDPQAVVLQTLEFLASVGS